MQFANEAPPKSTHWLPLESFLSVSYSSTPSWMETDDYPDSWSTKRFAAQVPWRMAYYFRCQWQ